ncbi:CPBP family intramembrane glutamic endopeptidase [Halocatena pleomorpha]|uniref:CPBP family intramembrane metalloprotease n=1 Tax=Halocatena pleomorpha TaxID=1785090 RepID=A0A3P3RL31_9EURY|nr:type II CAAX endopeptidase family protein [Halocatena pleomorpha]RRJ33570.1 CPBP family intramembrane metalloprotease [Halocatena pleomorpha]
MTKLTRDADPLPTLAFGVVIAWIALELLLRRGVVSVVASTIGFGFTADWIILLIGFPAMAAVLSAVALRAGHDVRLWEYEWSFRAVVAGLVGVVIALIIMAITSQIDATLFGLGETSVTVGDAVGKVLRRTPLLAVVFLLGNGVAVPIAEEQVWRAVVQSELVAGWGAVAGILLTAILFALKHVVVDLSIARLTTLLALGLVFGVLRHRYGTVSSVLTHIGVNVFSTASIVLLALV